MMKIATMATGGIGGYLAVLLANSGHQVATIARGDHLDAIRQNGLVLDGAAGRQSVQPWIATDDPAEVGEVDAIIFGVKGDGLKAAATLCKPMVGAQTVVVPFLNGVEAHKRLAQILPAENVASGVAQVSTTIAAPGIIKQTGEFSRFIFAECDSRPSKRIDALREAFNGAGLSAPPTSDIDCDLWSKFILFSAISGITTAARCTIGEIIENNSLSELFRAAVAESAMLGRKSGVALPGAIEENTWEFAKNLPPTLRASTAIDLEKGLPLEIDWITGAVVRLSRAIGLDAPINRTLYAILSPRRGGEPSVSIDLSPL